MTTTSEKARANTSRPKADVAETIAITRVLIGAKISEREMPARGERPARTRYGQEAILTAGQQARDLPFERNCYDKAETLQEGVYILPANTFKLSQYGSLELTYNPELIYVGPLKPEQKKLFERQKADMSDLMD